MYSFNSTTHMGEQLHHGKNIVKSDTQMAGIEGLLKPFFKPLSFMFLFTKNRSVLHTFIPVLFFSV